MKQLPVRFNDKQFAQLGDLVDAIGSTPTDTARAALALGMQQIKELAARDVSAAQEVVIMTAYKVQQ